MSCVAARTASQSIGGEVMARGASIQPVGQAVRDVCAQFPDAGTRTLATKLWNENRALFNTYESCRSLVRQVRGESGGRARGEVKSKVATTKHSRPRIPKSRYKDVPPYVFKQTGNGLIIADLHIPFHDEAAVDIAIEYAVKRENTDFLFVAGDLVDNHSQSEFIKDPREKDFAGELEAVEEFFDYAAGIFKKIYWKFGNHELRHERYLWHKAPEMLGVSDFELSTLTHCGERGIEVIPENVQTHVGGLTIVHGHEFKSGFAPPVNAARGLFMKAKASSMCGHHHATSEHTEQTVRGKSVVTWGIGCLCGLKPKFYPMAHTKWNHGFALLAFDGKDYEVENKRIVEGKVR